MKSRGDSTPSGSGSPSSSRPTQTYVTILKDVLGENEKTLVEIYDAITLKYPFFEASETGWKNTVRHTLSLNPSFKNVPKPSTASGKGGLWKIDSEAPEHYTRKREKKSKGGPLTTSVPQAGATRGTKRTRASTVEQARPGGGTAPTSSPALVAAEQSQQQQKVGVVDEDADAEGSSEEDGWPEADVEGAATLRRLAEEGASHAERGQDVSVVRPGPSPHPHPHPPPAHLSTYDQYRGENAGRAPQPSYQSAGGSSSTSSNWSSQPSSSAGGYHHPHQIHNTYPASFMDAPLSYQRGPDPSSSTSSSPYATSSSARQHTLPHPPVHHHHAASAGQYHASPQPPSSSSGDYPHPGMPSRHSYSNPSTPSFQLPPIFPPPSQIEPHRILPPLPSHPVGVQAFAPMRIAQPSPRMFHLEGGWRGEDGRPLPMTGGSERMGGGGSGSSGEGGGGGLGGGGRSGGWGEVEGRGWRSQGLVDEQQPYHPAPLSHPYAFHHHPQQQQQQPSQGWVAEGRGEYRPEWRDEGPQGGGGGGGAAGAGPQDSGGQEERRGG